MKEEQEEQEERGVQEEKEDVLRIRAERVELIGAVPEQECGLPHDRNGNVLQTWSWNNLQSRNMVRFAHALLSRDPEMQEEPPLGIGVREGMPLVQDLIDHPSADILSDDRYRALSGNAAYGPVMVDWIDRFGPLFRHLCKYEQISVESAREAVSRYQDELLLHVRELRRLWYKHVSEYPAVPRLLAHVRSRILGPRKDVQGEHLAFETLFPAVRVGEGSRGMEELRALAERDDDAVYTSPEDDYGKGVEGCGAVRRKLVHLLLSQPEKVVVLDAREEYRYRSRFQIYKESGIVVRVHANGSREVVSAHAGERLQLQRAHDVDNIVV